MSQADHLNEQASKTSGNSLPHVQPAQRKTAARLSRRTFLGLAAVVAGGLASSGLLAGCAAGARSAATPRPSATPTVVPTVRAKDTIVVAVTGDLAGFDPFNLTPANLPMLDNVYNQLLRYDSKLQVQPELAEIWQLGDGGLTLAMRLRGGLQFHSGRPLTAEDVVKNFARARDRDTGGHVYPLVSAVETVEAADQSTVIVRLREPTPAALDTMTLLSVANPEAFAALGKSDGGSGPFRIADWLPGDHLTLDRFPAYWDQPKPYLARAVLRIFGDEDAMVAALLGGAADAVVPLPLQYYARVRGEMVVEREAVPAGLYALYLNPQRPPFTRKEVRQAVRWALDRQAVTDGALFGVGEPALTFSAPGSAGYAEPAPEVRGIDRQRTKDLLALGGYGEGLAFTLAVPANAVELVNLALALKADLQGVGINLDVQAIEPPVWYARLNGGELQAALAIMNNVNRHPSWLLASPALRLVDNPFWPDGLPPAYTQAAGEAAASLDDAGQRTAYQRLQEVVLDEAWAIPLVWRHTLLAYRGNVKGLRRTVDGWLSLAEARKE